MRELSFLNKGIKLTLTDEREVDDQGNFLTSFSIRRRRIERVCSVRLYGNRPSLIAEPIYVEGIKNGIPVELALQPQDSYAENVHSYVNNINTHEGGTHIAGFRRGLTKNP